MYKTKIVRFYFFTKSLVIVFYANTYHNIWELR